MMPQTQQVALEIKFRELREEASKLELIDLDAHIEELRAVVAGGDSEKIYETFTLISGRTLGNLSNPLTKEAVASAFENYARMIGTALEIAWNPNIAALIAHDEDYAYSVLKILASQSSIDVAHSTKKLEDNMGAICQIKNRSEREEEIRIFGITAVENLRNQESNFQQSRSKIMSIDSGTEANALGKSAWKKRRFWTAEFAWTKALELDDKPHIRTNRAHVRVILGRRMRSLGIGYAEPARKMLQSAVSDAEISMAQDPTWARAMQRHAEALLAVGPCERAMDASKSLERLLQLPLPTEANAAGKGSVMRREAQALLERARAASRAWRNVLPNSSPGTALRRALRSLAQIILPGLGLSSGSLAELAAYGRRVAESMETVVAILQAGYTNPAWRFDGSEEVYQNVQYDLRKCAKCVPLAAVAASNELRRLVYMEDPWTVFGLDRLDRAGVDRLPLGASDPCQEDSEEDVIDERFQERVSRTTPDGTAMGLKEIGNVMDWLCGKSAASELRDMTPHDVFCAFSCTLLQRIVVSPHCSLVDAARRRVLELSSDGIGAWAGGDFLGHALLVSAGIYSYGVAADAGRHAQFMQLERAATTLAEEVILSKDPHFRIQKALAAITPEEWARQGALEACGVLRSYVFYSLDKRSYRLEGDGHVPYAAAVLASVLLANQALLSLLRLGDVQALPLPEKTVEPGDAEWIILGKSILANNDESAFAAYLIRRLGKACTREQARAGSQAADDAACVRAAVLSLAQKWTLLSPAERAGYRWESLPADKKARLSAAGLAPKGREELRRPPKCPKEAAEQAALDAVAVKPPACSACGRQDGPREPLRRCGKCAAVWYCSRECQARAWPEHRRQCVPSEKQRAGGSS